MGHRVRDNVDTHGIRASNRESFKEFFVLALSFPAIAKIIVVANQDHHSARFIE